MSDRPFPIMMGFLREKYEGTGCPEGVPWSVIIPHEQQAMDNHGRQTLKRLAERGGLSPLEMAAVLQDKTYREAREMTVEEAVEVIVRAVEGDDV